MALALPPAGRDRPAHLFTTAAVLTAAVGTSLFGALIAAYVGLRDATSTWPPRGVKPDMYLGGVLLVTLLLSSAFVEWAPAALRRGQPRQVMASLALTAFLGLAFLNGVWYFGSQLDLPARSSAYAGITYALLTATGVAVGAGVVLLLAAMAKIAGRQIGARDPDALRAVAWYWQFVVVSWVAVYSTLFLLK